MKKIRIFLTSVLCLSLLSPGFSVFADEVKADDPTDISWLEASDKEVFSPGEFEHIYELLNVVNEFWKSNRDLDICQTADMINKDEPSLSRVEVTVRTEKTGELIKDHVAGLGLDKNLLDIRVDPDFYIVIDIYRPYGDVNADMIVDMSDLSELCLMLLDNETFREDVFYRSDVNADGDVNLSDLSRLKQFVSGKDITLGTK